MKAIAVAIIPYVLIAVPPVAFLFFYLRRYFVTASRQVKRLEATTRSPVYSQISATLEGLATIRAYGVDNIFIKNFMNLQKENTKIFFTFLSTSRWLGMRLDVAAASFLVIITFLAVGLRGSLAGNTGLIGLVLSYCFQLLRLLQWCVRQVCISLRMMITLIIVR
jgi:ATP-binding cassette subfamily C (CFTR/MRP) protein 4